MKSHITAWTFHVLVAMCVVGCGTVGPEEASEAANASVQNQQRQGIARCPQPTPGSGPQKVVPGCDVCGDGVCGPSENANLCPSDCPSICGDGFCTGWEGTTTCPRDCGTRCGDGVCNGGETASTCAADCALPQDPEFKETILQSGGTWQLKNVQGSALDETTGVMRPFNSTVYVLQPDGIAQAPLPPTIRQELLPESTNRDSVITLDKVIADEIEVSVAQGSLTPYLQRIAEVDKGGVSGGMPGNNETGLDYQKFGSCSDRVINKSKTFNINTPLNYFGGLGGGFTGSASATGSIQASATGELQVALKRARVLFWCIPYGVRLNYARAYGTATVGYGSTLNGTINYTNAWETELTKISLFSLNFWLGPIPVHIGFNMPITLGLDLSASATGSVNYTGAQSATGSFNYTCTLSGCSGSAGYTQTNPGSPQIITAGVSGRVQPNLWIQAAVRAFLYTEWIAYAQVGVRPYLRGDLWGYYGNNCGDADGDGLFETVDALTFDLDLQVHLTAQARVFGGTPTQWNDLWHTPRYHLRYWDLIGSRALRPMLGGSSATTLSLSTPYTAQMRPCFPYTDTVNYQLAWGDGATTSLSGAPQTPTLTNHAWTTNGIKTLGLTALSDAHGRTFNQATSRNVSVSGGTWTPWLNRDLPSGYGDYETRVDFGALVPCASPVAIQCQTTAGVDWTQTGQVYSCTPAVGGVCVNANQPNGACMDYQVRFLCP